MKYSSYLKNSLFIVGLVRAFRGLTIDTKVVVWLLQRKTKIANYLGAQQVKKLQLGTSNNVLKGWLNTDIHPNEGSVVYLDATKRFPFDDNTFDYVMAEHMIEHVEFQGAQRMLSESYRVLKPGGRVRFATPDLSVLLALHSREKTSDQKNYINWAITRLLPDVKAREEVFIINNFFRAWGHLFLYDQETLHHALSISGFQDIQFYKPGESGDPVLRKIESHGREIGEEVNQFETTVVEGRKPG